MAMNRGHGADPSVLAKPTKTVDVFFTVYRPVNFYYTPFVLSACRFRSGFQFRIEEKMNRKNLIFLSSILFCASCFVTSAAAQPENPPGVPISSKAEKENKGAAGAEKTAQDEKDDKGAVLKPGVIASVGGGGSGPTAVSADTGGAAPGDEATAISASIKPGKGGKCEAIVSNTSETDTYSVSFAVQSFDKKSGKAGSSQSYSASLAPKKSVSRSVTCQKNDGLQIKLKKGIRTASTKKKPAEEAAVGVPAGGVPIPKPGPNMKRPTS